MKIYIVWCTDYNYNVNEHIVGIYKNKNSAIKKCKKYDNTFKEKKIKSDEDDDDMLGEFSSVNEECKYYCSVVDIDIDEDDKNIYFLKVTQDNGPGSYSIQHRIYAVSSMIEIIGHAETWFDEEHNRNKNCPKCKKYKKHLKYLKHKKYIKNKNKYISYKKYKKYENMNTDSEYDSETESPSDSESDIKSHKKSKSKSNSNKDSDKDSEDSDDNSDDNSSNESIEINKDTGLKEYKSHIKLFGKKRFTICKRKIIKDIYCNGHAYIDYTDYEQISFDIWKMKI
ncbi:hypothetical protein QKC54_gp0918 [Megavirus baoshan]|uniref:Uncharacterized protein n=1 Tax=Megavirus baoshan TaxID=2496520 RepID=A0A3Q8U8A9_9VIRU|nr:hypothetical protein QKC54_gp0918 [Megavirus baoshan]AZL89596.1 hypothetical protein Mb0154 [Megavirus baoshan]